MVLELSRKELEGLFLLLSQHMSYGWVEERVADLWGPAPRIEPFLTGEVSETLQDLFRRVAELYHAEVEEDEHPSCPECGGDGGWPYTYGHPRFLRSEEAWEPGEEWVTCPVCGGTGHAE